MKIICKPEEDEGSNAGATEGIWVNVSFWCLNQSPLRVLTFKSIRAVMCGSGMDGWGERIVLFLVSLVTCKLEVAVLDINVFFVL